MSVGHKGKPEISQYLPESTKTGDFNPWRTLSRLFFAIPERLASISSLVLAFTASKQTNTLKYIYRYYILHSINGGCMHWPACEKISPTNAGKYLRVKKHIHRKLANRTIQHIQYYEAWSVCMCACVHVMSSVKIVTARNQVGGGNMLHQMFAPKWRQACAWRTEQSCKQQWTWTLELPQRKR